MDFHFERLEVYAVAMDMLVVIDGLVASLPPGRSYIRDQLRRSSNSVVLNLVEGAGEFSPRDKARFYRISKRSATETAAQLVIIERLGLVGDVAVAKGLLHRVVSMLVKMVEATERRAVGR